MENTRYVLSRMCVYWLVTQQRIYANHIENTSSVLLAVSIACCITTVAARTTENTTPVLLAACVAGVA
jgi:hypothetical protein